MHHGLPIRVVCGRGQHVNLLEALAFVTPPAG
jgi:hypothetical protein